MSPSPYQQSRQRSKSPPSTRGPLPGLAVLLNYPPGPDDRDFVALIMPGYSLFTEADGTLGKHDLRKYVQEMVATQYDLDPYSDYDENLLVMVPKNPSLTIRSYLWKDDRGYHFRERAPRLFLQKFSAPYNNSRGSFAKVDPWSEGKLFTGKDEGMTLAHNLVRSFKISKNVYKIGSDTETESVDGYEQLMFRQLENTADSTDKTVTVPATAKGRSYVGAVSFISEPITVTYLERASEFKAGNLYPRDSLTPTDYFKEVSERLIERVRSINALFNVLATVKDREGGEQSALPKGLRLEIGGHTDCVGNNNAELSRNRAKGIMDFLTTADSITRIRANPDGTEAVNHIQYALKGYGETECSCADPTKENPECRRVTLRMT